MLPGPDDATSVVVTVPKEAFSTSPTALAQTSKLSGPAHTMPPRRTPRRARVPRTDDGISCCTTGRTSACVTSRYVVASAGTPHDDSNASPTDPSKPI